MKKLIEIIGYLKSLEKRIVIIERFLFGKSKNENINIK